MADFEQRTARRESRMNQDLINVGKTYDVIHFGAQHTPLDNAKLGKDKPHFSTDGH